MRSALLPWLGCPAVGPRLVSFSEAHGPSALHGVGIAAILLGWAAFLVGRQHGGAATGIIRHGFFRDIRGTLVGPRRALV
jgi:hypothetical protein